MTRGNVLQHAARRRVVRLLLDEGGAADVGALVSAQVAATDDTFVDAATAFHDLHAPKLESAGLVECIEDETTVELVVPADCARELLADAE